MFDGLLKSKSQIKCKSSIKLTKTRLEMIKKKRSAMQKYLKKDIADLLQNGLDPNAYARAEGFLGEMNLSSCYEHVELSCLCISNHLSAMCKNRECPEECREAVSSLMFAAARFADLPELRELRAIFTDRYGKSVECYANKEFVAKLKSVPHSKDEKLQLLQDIAHESGIEWNSKALEQKLYKPPPVEQKPNATMISTLSQNAFKNGSASDKHNQKVTSRGREQQDLRSEGEDEVAHADHGIVKSKRTPSTNVQPKITDQDVQQSIFHSAKSSSKDELDSEKSTFRYSSIPPPYTRAMVSRTDPTSDVLPSGSTAGEAGPRKQDAQPDNESKPKPKSVRSRPAKLLDPPPGYNNIGSFKGDETFSKKSAGKKQEDAKQSGVVNLSDEEERKMDKLLLHYSNKNASPETSKEEPKSRRKEYSLQSRAASLPVEPTSLIETKRGHARATSYEPDFIANGHIHPKLPDYDEFVAQLAAFREKGK